MEFGLVGVEGLVVGQNGSSSCSEQPQILEGKPKCNNGSGLIKQERFDPFSDEENRTSKMVKRAEDFGFRYDDDLPKQQMLSFSLNKPQVNYLTAKDVGLIADKNAQNLVLSYYQQNPP